MTDQKNRFAFSQEERRGPDRARDAFSFLRQPNDQLSLQHQVVAIKEKKLREFL